MYICKEGKRPTVSMERSRLPTSVYIGQLAGVDDHKGPCRHGPVVEPKVEMVWVQVEATCWGGAVAVVTSHPPVIITVTVTNS